MQRAFSANPYPAIKNTAIDGSTPHEISNSGVVQADNRIVLTTDSPAWIAFQAVASNTVNTLTFDATFTSSAAAQGLLSVYWNSNVIGIVDERAILPGEQHAISRIPATSWGSGWIHSQM